MILPRIGAGLYGSKLIASFVVGEQLPLANEVRIDWCGMLVDQVPVAARSIGLPDLHQGKARWLAVLIQYPAREHNFLSQGCLLALHRQVSANSEMMRLKGGSGGLRKSLRDRDQWVGWRPFPRRYVFGMKMRGMNTGCRFSVSPECRYTMVFHSAGE